MSGSCCYATTRHKTSRVFRLSSSGHAQPFVEPGGATARLEGPAIYGRQGRALEALACVRATHCNYYGLFPAPYGRVSRYRQLAQHAHSNHAHSSSVSSNVLSCLTLLASKSSDTCEILIRKDIAAMLATTMEIHLTDENIQVCQPRLPTRHVGQLAPIGAKLLASGIVFKACQHRL